LAPALHAPAARRVVLAVATCAGAGLVPAIPGTCGAALGVALFLLFAPAPLWLLALTWLGLLALGTWAADVAGRLYEREDDARIVIDEVVGQLLALSPLLTPLLDANYWSVVTAFVLFRSFDIGKMGPVGWVERRVRGGLGVMLDDLVAGALSAVILLLLGRFTPLWPS